MADNALFIDRQTINTLTSCSPPIRDLGLIVAIRTPAQSFTDSQAGGPEKSQLKMERKLRRNRDPGLMMRLGPAWVAPLNLNVDYVPRPTMVLGPLYA